MIQLLCPNECADSVQDVNLADLKKKGIQGIILDLDNTLLAWGNDDVSEEMVSWIQEVKRYGFKICIASNALKTRVKNIAKELDVPAISKAVKPRKKPFKRALKLLNLSKENVAVIGDQLFTDVLGGNRMQLYTILINPISRKEFRATKVVRRVEKHFMSRLHKKGLLSKQALKVRNEINDSENKKG